VGDLGEAGQSFFEGSGRLFDGAAILSTGWNGVFQIERIGLVITALVLHSLIGPSPTSGFVCLCPITGTHHGIAPFPVPHKSGRISFICFIPILF
jgi:hypothetical protein